MEITVAFASAVVDRVRAIAAREIVPRFRTVVAERKDDGSLLTEADLESQRALMAGLRAIEDAPVLGEEMPRETQLAIWERGGRYWCVDPLDGTANFAHGVPFFAVSVALMDGDLPQLGVVHDPIADETFFAVRGAGAWLGPKPLRVPEHAPPLAEARAEVGWRRDINALRGAFKHRSPCARRVTGGCATLAWCQLAAARIDVMVSGNQKMWDFAAGALIAQEAGARLSGVVDDDFWAGHAWTRSVIAARGAELLAEWRNWVRAELRRS